MPLVIQAVEESFSVAASDSVAVNKSLEASFASFTVGNLITVPVPLVKDPIVRPVIEEWANPTLEGW